MLPRINEFLPWNIRALGLEKVRVIKVLKKVSNSWNARKHCNSRTYEYWVPWRIIRQSRYSLDEIQLILDQFIGLHYWHNFAGRSSFHVYREGESLKHDQTLESIREEGIEDAMEEDDEGEVFEEGEIRLNANIRNYSRQEQVQVKPSGLVRRRIHDFFIDSPVTLKGPSGSQKWVPFTLVGQSFLPYQIRKMMSMALSVFLGHLPPFAVSLAVNSSLLFALPLAPPNYLILTNNKFREPLLRQRGVYREMTDFKSKAFYPHLLEMDLKENHFDHFAKRWLPPTEIHDWEEVLTAAADWELIFASKRKIARMNRLEQME